MLDILFTCRRLPALLLLLAVLGLPLHSLALEPMPAPSQDCCICQLGLADAAADDREGNPAPPHGSGADDCCDSEERSLDAADSIASCLIPAISSDRLSRPDTGSYLPRVYLSIFVPPQS